MIILNQLWKLHEICFETALWWTSVLLKNRLAWYLMVSKAGLSKVRLLEAVRRFLGLDRLPEETRQPPMDVSKLRLQRSIVLHLRCFKCKLPIVTMRASGRYQNYKVWLFFIRPVFLLVGSDVCHLQTFMIRKRGCVAGALEISPVVTRISFVPDWNGASNWGCFDSREPSSIIRFRVVVIRGIGKTFFYKDIQVVQVL